MTVKTNELSAGLFLRLYTSVGWKPPGIEQVQTALKNTTATLQNTSAQRKRMCSPICRFTKSSVSKWTFLIMLVDVQLSRGGDCDCAAIKDD